jgi:hypothetical protein
MSFWNGVYDFIWGKPPETDLDAQIRTTEESIAKDRRELTKVVAQGRASKTTSEKEIHLRRATTINENIRMSQQRLTNMERIRFSLKQHRENAAYIAATQRANNELKKHTTVESADRVSVETQSSVKDVHYAAEALSKPLDSAIAYVDTSAILDAATDVWDQFGVEENNNSEVPATAATTTTTTVSVSSSSNNSPTPEFPNVPTDGVQVVFKLSAADIQAYTATSAAADTPTVTRKPKPKQMLRIVNK